MLNAVYCEFLKLKKLKLPLMILICILIPIIISHSSSYYNNLIVLEDYFKFIIEFNWILFTVLFSLIAGMIFFSEYKNNTIKNIFCYPMSRAKLFGAKMITFMCIIFIIHLLSLLVSLILVLLMKHRHFSGELLLHIFGAYIISTIGFICFMCLSVAVCIFTERVIYPLIFSFLCILYLFIFLQIVSILNWMYFCPATSFLRLSIGVLEGEKIPVEMIYLTYGGLIISLILGCAFSIYVYRKRDVR